MKILKVKSLFLSMLAMMAIAVLLTSCEQESLDLIPEENIENLLTVPEENRTVTVYDAADLPADLPTTAEVLEWASAEDNSIDKPGEDVESRGICGCSRVIRYKTNGCWHTIDWKSENNLALFVYHYRVSDNKSWVTRIDPDSASCTFSCDGFYFNPPGNNGLIRSVAFLGSGYTVCSSKTKYWYDCQ